MPRTITIADVHGCSGALASILRAISPQFDDMIIYLGDYVDRRFDSKGIIDLLIELSGRCRLVPILGNHDEMMLRARDSAAAYRMWMEFGGITTLDSYGASGQMSLIPEQHFKFLESCWACFETDKFFFLRANYDPALPLYEQHEQMLRWRSLRDYVPGPHCSGKIAVVGHTPQSEVLDIGHLICIDTGCAYDGKLTAM